jgi:hypothetical protein
MSNLRQRDTLVRKREAMPADAYIDLGNRATALLLFSYPNTGHEDQTPEQTIEHYFNDSLRREEIAGFQVEAQMSDAACRVRISAAEADIVNQIARRYQAFFDIGKIGLQDVVAFRESGKWDAKWQFFLPLGVPIAFARAVEIMDFPPLTLISNQDYLRSKTTSRWWELLILNGVSEADKALYSCILDIVPVAAPASDGVKLAQSGIYDGPFDQYGLPLLKALVGTQTPSVRRPLIALGMPIRSWILRNWKLTLNVVEVGSITLDDGDACAVIASNHPSFFYYAVHSNTGPNAAEKNLAAGLAVMKQDIVCAAWHAEMGRSPVGDPNQVLQASVEKWKDRDAELLALVKKQAGIPKPLEESLLAQVQLDQVMEFVPSAEDLKALEKRFYAEGAEYRV